MRVELVYKGRSGKFKRGKTYSTTWSSVGRGGSKSPSTWTFTLNGWFSNYRITQYEFKKYWKYLDNSVVMTLLLREMYSGTKYYIKDLIYKDNPFLSMTPKSDGWTSCIPVPLVYKLTSDK